jgi:hypothetical protein
MRADKSSRSALECEGAAPALALKLDDRHNCAYTPNHRDPTALAPKSPMAKCARHFRGTSLKRRSPWRPPGCSVCARCSWRLPRSGGFAYACALDAVLTAVRSAAARQPQRSYVRGTPRVVPTQHTSLLERSATAAAGALNFSGGNCLCQAYASFNGRKYTFSQVWARAARPARAALLAHDPARMRADRAVRHLRGQAGHRPVLRVLLTGARQLPSGHADDSERGGLHRGGPEHAVPECWHRARDCKPGRG